MHIHEKGVRGGEESVGNINIQMMSTFLSSMHTKMLRLDRDKRELERNFEVLKKSTERATAERENMMRKLTSQNHAAQKELAKLKEVSESMLLYCAICV